MKRPGIDPWHKICKQCPLLDCKRGEGDYIAYQKGGAEWLGCPIWEGRKKGWGPVETLDRLGEIEPSQPRKRKRGGRKACPITNEELMILREQGMTLLQIVEEVELLTGVKTSSKMVAKRLKERIGK